MRLHQTICGLILAALMLIPSLGRAGGGLSGTWTYTQTFASGNTLTEVWELRQNGDHLSGSTYHVEEDGGFPQPLEGQVNPDGSVVFTLYYLYDYGTPITCRGQLSSDRDSLTGTYSIGDSQGSFRLVRGGDIPKPAPQTGTNLAGAWVFTFENPTGEKYADPCEIQQEGDSFSGIVTYYETGQQMQEDFEGIINADGSLHFTLYEGDEAYLHQGTLGANGARISGQWLAPEGSAPFEMIRLP